MALNVDVIEITQPASTLNRIQTYNLAAGFDPKAIIIFGTPQTTDGSLGSWLYGIGYGTYRGGTVQQVFSCMRGLDAAGSADTGAAQGNDAVFKIMTNSAGSGTIDCEIDLISMTNSGTPNVVLDWANFHTSAGIKLFMIVLGGSDITDAFAGMDGYGAGVTSYPVDNTHGYPVGMGQPDFVFMASSRDTPGNSAVTPQWTSGFGKKGEDGRSFSFVQTDGNTASIVAASQRVDRIFRKIAPGGASTEASARLSAPGSWPSDGFELTFDAATSFACEFYYLALKGTFQSITGHGDAPIAGGLPVVQDLAAGFAPKLGYIDGWNLISNGAIATTAGDLVAFGIGATDGTTEAWAGFTEDDAATTMDSNMQRTNTKVIRNYNPAAVLQSEADGSFSGSNFRLSWNDIDGVQRQYQWFVLGDAPGGGSTIDFAAVIAGAGAVAMQADRTRGIAAVVAGLGAVSAPIARQVGLNVTVAGNGALAAALARTRSLDAAVAGMGAVAVDMLLIKLMEANIAGQGSVAAQQLSITRSLAVSVSGQGALTVQESVSRALAVAIAGQGSVAAQQVLTRSLAAAVAGQGVVVVDLTLFGSVDFAVVVSGQGAVVVPLSVARGFAASIAGQGAVVVQQNPLRGFAATIAGQGAVTVQDSIVRGFAAVVAGNGQLAAQLARTIGMAATIAGAGSVTVALDRIKEFQATVAGQAAVAAAIRITRALGVTLAGQGTVSSSLSETKRFAVVVAGIAQVIADLTSGQRYLREQGEDTLNLAQASQDTINLAGMTVDQILLDAAVSQVIALDAKIEDEFDYLVAAVEGDN